MDWKPHYGRNNRIVWLCSDRDCHNPDHDHIVYEQGDHVRHSDTPGIAMWYIGPAERVEYDPMDPGQETYTYDHTTAVVRMVGDDRDLEVPVDELEPLDSDEFCSGCGQIGCHAYG